MDQLTPSQMTTNQDLGSTDMVNVTVVQLLLAYVTVTPAAEAFPSNHITHFNHLNRYYIKWLSTHWGVQIL